MLRFAVLAVAGMAFCCPAKAEPRWTFEFELVQLVTASSRVLDPRCTKVIPAEIVPYYDGRDGWNWSCGNDQPMYLHWIGRRIGRPLPNLELQVGWRHFSSPGDNNEINFDAIGVRGRFRFGKSD